MLKALKDLTKDTLTYGVADAAGKVIGFFLLPLYTSYLTPQDYGIISMLAFTYTFFSPLAALGVTSAIFRRFNLAKEAKDQKLVLSTGGLFVLINSTVLWIIAMLLAPNLTRLLIDDVSLVYLFKIALAGCFFNSIGSIFTVLLRATRRVKLISVTLLIKLTFTILLTIYLVVILEKGAIGVVVADALGAFIVCIILAYHSRAHLIQAFSRLELKALLSYGLPHFPHKILGTAMGFLVAYLIKELGSLEETGLYNIASKMAMPLALVISSIQKSWVPIKFQIHRDEEDEGERRQTFREIISTYFIVVGVLFTGVLIIGPEMIRLLTNSDYYGAVYLFPLVLLTKLATGVYFMMGTGFEYTNNTKPMPLVSLSGVVTLVGLSFLLSVWLGVKGVILASVVASLIMAAVMRSFAVKRFYVPLNWKVIFSTLALSLILTVFVISIQALKTNYRIAVTVGAISAMATVVFLLRKSILETYLGRVFKSKLAKR